MNRRLPNVLLASVMASLLATSLAATAFGQTQQDADAEIQATAARAVQVETVSLSDGRSQLQNEIIRFNYLLLVIDLNFNLQQKALLVGQMNAIQEKIDMAANKFLDAFFTIQDGICSLELAVEFRNMGQYGDAITHCNQASTFFDDAEDKIADASAQTQIIVLLIDTFENDIINMLGW